MNPWEALHQERKESEIAAEKLHEKREEPTFQEWEAGLMEEWCMNEASQHNHPLDEVMKENHGWLRDFLETKDGQELVEKYEEHPEVAVAELEKHRPPLH